MIKDFVKKNKLSFKQGNRNTTVIILIGYSQHLGLSKNKLKAELVDYIDKDSFIEEEVERLWGWCQTKNYKDYWTTSAAKKSYKF